jgi:hypothetical protein
MKKRRNIELATLSERRLPGERFSGVQCTGEVFMRTLLSFVTCMAVLAALAACSQPPINPNGDHGAQNAHGPAAIPAPADAARV